MSRQSQRWSEQDIALIKARQGFARAVKSPPVEAITARTYTFTIPGLAHPGGSKKAFALYDKKKVCRCGPVAGFVPLRRPNGSIIINVTADNDERVKRWRKHVARIAHEEYAGPLFDGFLRVTFIFYQRRPQSHYTSTGKLSKEGIETPWPNVKPDTTKLVRATEDALTGLCWTDDAVIVKQVADKEYGTPPRVEITIEELIPAESQDQPALFEFEGSQPPWETAASAADHQQPTPGKPARANGARPRRETSGAGTSHSDRNQTPGKDDPPPWDVQDPARSEKKNGKNSRGR